MPSLPVTLAFVAACSGDREHWRQRWLDTTGGVFRSTARSGRAVHDTSGQACPAQLPQRPRAFIGRAIELASLRCPGDTPIVFSGPIGAGKTDLALHYAYERAAGMPDGQLYADLGAQHAEDAPSPYDIIDGFLRALGIPSDQLRGTPGHRAGLYRTVLAERRLVVLLDNVRNEQQVRPLLVETATSTTLLVSRRRLLGLRHVRRLHIGPLPRADSIALIAAALPDSVRTAPADFDRLAALCGDLPQALDIALRRIALRPHVVLRDLLNGWQQSGIALSWLSIGDLSMRESLRSACRTLSREARALLHWHAQIAADDGSLPAPEDEAVDELIDAGLLTYAHHGHGGLVLSPLVRAFARDMGGGDNRDLPVDAAIPHAG